MGLCISFLSGRYIPCRTGTDIHANFTLTRANRHSDTSMLEDTENSRTGTQYFWEGKKRQYRLVLCLELDRAWTISCGFFFHPCSVLTSFFSSQPLRLSMVESEPIYNFLLKNELFGDVQKQGSPYRGSTESSDTPSRSPDSHGSGNIFRFQSESKQSPVLEGQQALLRVHNTPQRMKRKISRAPYKVLNAPNLQDDFYLNLVDWSSSNILAVGLEEGIYLWSAFTSKVTKLKDGPSSPNEVCSVG